MLNLTKPDVFCKKHEADVLTKIGLYVLEKLHDTFHADPIWIRLEPTPPPLGEQLVCGRIPPCVQLHSF